MLKRPSENRLTLEERVAVIVAIAVAFGVHLLVFLGGSGLSHFAQEETKRERLMVIRQVREITPAPEIAVRVPDTRRVRIPIEPESEGKSGGSPPPPKAELKVTPHGALPPPKPEITPKMEEELQDSLRKEQEEKEKAAAEKSAEVGDNSVSVVTDLPAASYTVSGPVEYRGTGTFWIRRGAPAGTYRIAFSAVPGFGLPPPQTKELPAKGQIVFVGKYKRSTEVVVDSNNPGAQFTVYRPDGRPLDVQSTGRTLIDDLPPGTYTAVFKDMAGHITPGPQSRTLAPGGKLSFYGEYQDTPNGRTGAAGEEGAVAGARGSRYGTGSGSGGGDGTGSGGSGSGRGGKAPVKSDATGDKGLDQRVKIIVTSYPQTTIERRYDEIPYPAVIIRKSNFQQGICQVYLILRISERGDVTDITVQRPTEDVRPKFEMLIGAVENAVRSWDYDKVQAEVHVDVRFYVE